MSWCNCDSKGSGNCTCRSREIYDNIYVVECPCNAQSIQEIQNCPCNSQNTCTCNTQCTAEGSNWIAGRAVSATMMNDIQTRIEAMAVVHKYSVPAAWKLRYTKGNRLLLAEIKHTRDEIDVIVNNTKSKFNIDFGTPALAESPLKATFMSSLYERTNHMTKWCICNGYVENAGACTCNTRCSCNTNCTCNSRCSCNARCTCDDQCSCNGYCGCDCADCCDKS